MLRTSRVLIDSLTDYCLRQLPLEACGVLLGQSEGNILTVDGFHPLPNASRAPGSRFLFEPAEWVSLLYRCQREGLTPHGVFHSHPAAPPSPSYEDLASDWPFRTYWIVSFADSGPPEWRAFHKKSPSAYEEQNIVIDTSLVSHINHRA